MARLRIREKLSQAAVNRWYSENGFSAVEIADWRGAITHILENGGMLPITVNWMVEWDGSVHEGTVIVCLEGEAEDVKQAHQLLLPLAAE